MSEKTNEIIHPNEINQPQPPPDTRDSLVRPPGILGKFKETENFRKDSVQRIRSKLSENRKLSAYNAKNARLAFLHKKSTIEDEDDDAEISFLYFYIV